MKRKKKQTETHEVHFRARGKLAFDWQSRPKSRVFEDRKKKENKWRCRGRVNRDE